MQKVVRRTALAHARLQRRNRLRGDKELLRDREEFRKQMAVYEGEKALMRRQALRARKEDFEMGPLSPHRGALGAADPNFGAASLNTLSLPSRAKRDRAETLFIREDDRVVVVAGHERERGKIGKVIRIEKEAQSVQLEGVNLMDFKPDERLRMSKEKMEVSTRPRSIRLEDVRLVYPMPDPKTGIPKDTIIKHMVKGNEYVDPYGNEKKWSRYVWPQNIRIPWPDEGQKEEQFETQDSDTERINVEEASFTPTLLRPPMPLGVIDELRNKYSSFRTRHDPEYIAAKTAEDEEAARIKALQKAMVPQGARNIARGKSSMDGNFMATKEPVEISKDVLEVVGAYMASKGITLPESKNKKKKKKRLAELSKAIPDDDTTPMDLHREQLRDLGANDAVKA